MNNPKADDGISDHVEDRMLVMIARAENGERVTEAEHVLECEPESEDEWDALQVPESIPAPFATVGKYRTWWWHWLWHTDAEAYSRWMTHRLKVATDEQLTRIIEDSRI